MMRGHETVVHLTQSATRFTIEFRFDGQAMNTSDFVLDGQTHPGQLGATQQARWTRRFSAIEIDIHRPASGPMPGGDEHLIWELDPGGQTIRRTSTRANADSPPQIYVYRRIQRPSGEARDGVPLHSHDTVWIDPGRRPTASPHDAAGRAARQMRITRQS
jgi:hypothetical protein